MKSKLIAFAIGGLMLAGLTQSCEKEAKRGCTDPNADNYVSDADVNTTCRYRYASNIDIVNVPAKNSAGDDWDAGSGPDLKINFGKSSNSGYDHSTTTAEDYPGGTATVNPGSVVQFTNESWKFELVDTDPLGSEVIATGTFNPLSSTSNNQIEVNANGIVFRFKYIIQ